ncbi:MAG: ribosomal RNA small subunit methyltransferase A [Saprospiraceae bacterium]|nr:ribosomal RNA small subunit methyltransferase A [Saprospiraceae bacterium]
MKAKKSYGQHFLINQGFAAQIANSLTQLPKYPNVLEIGPGKGVLTQYLQSQSLHLKMIEADIDMVHYLEKHFPTLKDQIIFLDFLKVKIEKVFDGEPFHIIGNFPYNISSPILIKMINHHDLVPEMVGMFQKEVADRVIALPEVKHTELLASSFRHFIQVSCCLMLVLKTLIPPPKVNSAVIRLVRKTDTTLDCNEKLFRNIVKTTFSQRRKMLRNTLKSSVLDETILSDAYFNQRPEQLSVADFVNIVNMVEPYIKS